MRTGPQRSCRPAPGAASDVQANFEDLRGRRPGAVSPRPSRWVWPATRPPRPTSMCGSEARRHRLLYRQRGRQRDFVQLYRGMSADATHVFFTTTEKLAAADTDSSGDVSSGSRATRHSVGRDGGGQRPPQRVVPRCVERRHQGVHRDGRVAGRRRHRQRDDVYERAGAATTLISTGPSGGTRSGSVVEGVVCERQPRLLPNLRSRFVGSDRTSRIDVYERTSGATTLDVDGARRRQRTLTTPCCRTSTSPGRGC